MLSASWFNQFRVCFVKNGNILLRRPVHLILLLLSSVISVVFAWLAGRDSRGPKGQWPQFNECGQVDAFYYQSISSEYFMQNGTLTAEDSPREIPISLNEAWRSGLPVFLMSLGPLVTGISSFLFIRDELASQRWGYLRSAGLADSAHWLSWLAAFAITGLINSLAGAVTVASLPGIHTFSSVNFGLVFATLWILNLALVSASFFLAALCGTINSTTLTVFVILAMMIASCAPLISTSSKSRPHDPGDSNNIYDGGTAGIGGIFWLYGSTEKSYNSYGAWFYDEETGESKFMEEDDLQQCQVPIVSDDQDFFPMDATERGMISKENFFQGCFILSGASSYFSRSATSLLFWFFMPESHFFMAWGNIVGYTSLPNNVFSVSQVGKSPEVLAKESMANFRGVSVDELYSPRNTNGTSLFEQGSTIVLDNRDIPYSYYHEDPRSNCPSGNLSDLCNDYSKHCRSPTSDYPSSDSPSVFDCFGFLATLVAIYTVLAAYVAQVLPMRNGAAIKMYSPLLPRYWKNESIDIDTAQGEDEEEGRGLIRVQAVDVEKSYGQVKALKPFSFDLRVGEITALLGHNGAGKTTFANILSCEQNTTGGDILVFGHSIVDQPHRVRKMMGLCKQDDYLWPTLNVREHLEIFGSIRGIFSSEIPETVQKWLESLDLDLVSSVYSSTLSGGMKRRLSVGISTIGGASVVCLDEPTTGMDPISRRCVWKHIDEIKSDRVILLTTHAMEEADLLSDTVAIMCNGSLAACGSPLELKTQHGSAIHFQLTIKKENVMNVLGEVKRQFKSCLDWVSIEAGDAGYLSLSYKRVCTEGEDGVPLTLLSNFIGWLESNEAPILEWGFSNRSLEEVFLEVTKTAMSSRDIAFTQKKGCCCWKINTPISAEKEAAGANLAKSSNDSEINSTQQPRANFSDYERKLSSTTQALAIFRVYMLRSFTGRPSLINWILLITFKFLIAVTGFWMAILWPNEGIYPILTLPILLLTASLLAIVSPIYSDRHSGAFKMMELQGMSCNSFILGFSMYSIVVQLSFCFTALSLFYATPLFRDAETPTCDASIDSNCGLASFGSKPYVSPYNQILVFSGDDVQVFAHMGSEGYWMILIIILTYSMTFPGAALSSYFLPGHRLALMIVALTVILASVTPIIHYASTFFDYNFIHDCIQNMDEAYRCPQMDISQDDFFGGFVDCMGLRVSSASGIICTPPYVSMLPQVGLFNTLALSLSSRIVFYSEPPNYVEDVLIPSLEHASCSGNSCRWSVAMELYWKNIGFMILGAALLVIWGLLATRIFIFPSGFILLARNAINRRYANKRNSNECDSPTFISDDELPEVEAERKKVISMIAQDVKDASYQIERSNYRKCDRESYPLVLMHKIRKVFPPLGGAPSKVALESFDVHVESGEVLGLLGKNGAGKTTVLRILAGNEYASSGIGLVSGFNVETEQEQLYHHLGYCQQFDCIWKDQSVKRHLEFFAKLKGIVNPNDAAKEIATAVGLGAPDVYNRDGGKLSGGMRRRLSIAVSLLGSPGVLLLDEPTTGLDPSTRNEIWGLISSFATSERAIILTTHMMIEADTLCSRIAIVSRGSLKVIGTNQYLKDKYGSGDLLQLNLAQSNEESITSALQYVRTNIHQNAKIATKHAKTLHFHLPRDVSVRDMFTCLYRSESAVIGGINQFFVSQSSLDDVFTALGD